MRGRAWFSLRLSNRETCVSWNFTASRCITHLFPQTHSYFILLLLFFLHCLCTGLVGETRQEPPEALTIAEGWIFFTLLWKSPYPQARNTSTKLANKFAKDIPSAQTVCQTDCNLLTNNSLIYTDKPSVKLLLLLSQAHVYFHV